MEKILSKSRKLRANIKTKLIKRNILPKFEPYTDKQQKIMDMLKASMYPQMEQYVMETYGIDLKKRLVPPRPPKLPKPSPANMIKKRTLVKLLKFDLVSENDETATDIQKEIKTKVINENVKYSDIIKQYINHGNDLCKQIAMYERLASSFANRRDKGLTWDISPNEIIINEYCPFLGTKLTYTKINKGDSVINDTTASNDRFDNSKGYVSGNVWVISRLANTMKNAATIDELKTFCQNVLKQFYEDNPNFRF